MPLKAQLAKVIATEAYRKAPDGAADLKGTKASMVAGIIVQYRQAAMRRLRTDPVVREALNSDGIRPGHQGATLEAPAFLFRRFSRAFRGASPPPSRPTHSK